jgi:hypothetical protein
MTVIDYHPELDDPWLLLAFLLLALIAVGMTVLVKRSKVALVVTGLALTVASPFVVSGLVHSLYLLVNPDIEQILCTHWVRRWALPEFVVVMGIAAGLVVGRSWPRRLVKNA